MWSVETNGQQASEPTQDSAASTYWKSVEADAERGSPDAQMLLAGHYLGATPIDYINARTWALKATEQGNSEAQTVLGSIYYDGLGVTKDYAEAKKWLLKSAAQNVADAQDILGHMYYVGEGTPVNYSESLKWYLKAVDHDSVDPQAQFALGIMYFNGRGTAKDYTTARVWLTKAAEHDVAPAQALLEPSPAPACSSKIYLQPINIVGITGWPKPSTLTYSYSYSSTPFFSRA